MITDVLPIDVFWSLLCALSVAPVGYMLGSSCSPCCGPQGCGVADGKPRTDPATEGHWVPSGAWASGVTWTFSSSPSTTDGGTWFFYGSASTSKVGGGATSSEISDWGNICNWYSNKTTTPSNSSSITTSLNKRATRLPPDDAVVHVYSSVSTASTGPVTVKNAYFWSLASTVSFLAGSELTASTAAHDSPGGSVFNGSSNRVTRNLGTINGGATFNGFTSQNSGGVAVVNGGGTFNNTSRNTLSATVNGGATFNDTSQNYGGAIVNGSATFNDSARNADGGVVNDGATFNDSSQNYLDGVINGGATFNGTSKNYAATVNGGANFYDTSENYLGGIVNDGATFNGATQNRSATVNGGATFNGTSRNMFLTGIVNDGAIFNDSSQNYDNATVNGGATFNDSSVNDFSTVNGGATFNDAACSTRTVGSFANCPGPSERIFVAHPTDLPTCNGTAPDGCASAADTCGCG